MRYVELSARDVRAAYEHAIEQLPALPPRSSTTSRRHRDSRIPIDKQFERFIARVEYRRRDCVRHDPGQAQALARLVKRLRAAHHDFKEAS